jgi:hypothetical protein
MTVLRQLDRFLLSSAIGKTVLGPVVTTGAAVLLGLPADPQPSPLLAGRITLVLLVVCGTWYGVRRSELERAASEARSRDFENRFEALIDEATDRIVERAERAEEAAVGALRSSLCGLEAQAASADVAAATTARAYLALLEGEGLTVSPGDPAAGSEPEEPLA